MFWHAGQRAMGGFPRNPGARVGEEPWVGSLGIQIQTMDKLASPSGAGEAMPAGAMAWVRKKAGDKLQSEMNQSPNELKSKIIILACV